MSAGRRILIVGVNWLGDGIMTMPALQVFRKRYPQDHIAMLVKPPLKPLWELHASVDDIITLTPGNRGVWKTASALRKGGFDQAYVFPNSWRSALVPLLAGVPERIGTAGHNRNVLLTSRIRLSERAVKHHQQWEYVDILQLGDVDALPPPWLTVPSDPRFEQKANQNCQTVGLIPGAARGASKQWPEAHFIEASRQVRKQTACRFLVFGTATEADVCQRITEALDPDAVNFAGRTSLGELAAGLSTCDAVICNDSGGMHLAAATGTPVIAIYGLTSPAKTGPLGTGHCCIQADPEKASRDIARNDPAAQAALRRILPETVANAVTNILSPAS
jgi:heptosyltransferase-2